MAEASSQFVFLEDLQEKIGERLSKRRRACNGDDRRWPREDAPPARPDRNEERGPDPETPGRPHAVLSSSWDVGDPGT